MCVYISYYLIITLLHIMCNYFMYKIYKYIYYIYYFMLIIFMVAHGGGSVYLVVSN